MNIRRSVLLFSFEDTHGRREQFSLNFHKYDIVGRTQLMQPTHMLIENSFQLECIAAIFAQERPIIRMGCHMPISIADAGKPSITTGLKAGNGQLASVSQHMLLQSLCSSQRSATSRTERSAFPNLVRAFDTVHAPRVALIPAQR